MPVPWGRISGLAIVLCLAVGLSGQAQSSRENAPAHLRAGVNRATLDSSAGAQYWDVVLGPGPFRLVFANDRPQQVFPAGHEPKVSLTLLPAAQGAAVTQRQIPGGGTVFEGSVAQRTRVAIAIEPVKSPVRELLDYTLVATGSVDFERAQGAMRSGDGPWRTVYSGSFAALRATSSVGDCVGGSREAL